MELHQAPGSPVLSPPSWSPLSSQTQHFNDEGNGEEDTYMYEEDPNQEESEPICASVVPPPPLLGLPAATSTDEFTPLHWSSATRQKIPTMLSTTTTISSPESRPLTDCDGFPPHIGSMMASHHRTFETPGRVKFTGLFNMENLPYVTGPEGKSVHHVDNSAPQNSLCFWFEFQARFPRDLEPASLCLIKSILSSLRVPLTTDSWNNAVAILPIPLSNCSIAGIGIYHVVRQLALNSGRAAPGPLFVPALGRLAILLPNNVRWPATLTQPPENYASWPGKRFLDRQLRAVSDAAEVLSAYTLQLSVEILNSADSHHDLTDLAMRCFSTLDLIARFVSDMIALCKNENRVRLRSQWDPYLLKFLRQHRVVPKSQHISEVSSPLQFLFNATLEDRAAIESDLADLENEHNLGPCIHWTQSPRQNNDSINQ